MRRMKRYLEKRDLVLNTNKSKLMVFKKGRGTKKKEKWKWGDKEIEEKKLQISRIPFPEKRRHRETHRGCGKENDNSIKTNMGNRTENVEKSFDERRMKIYESLARSIMLYAAEIWWWSGAEKLENLQKKYIKWTLGLDYNTPTYIVLKET